MLLTARVLESMLLFARNDYLLLVSLPMILFA